MKRKKFKRFPITPAIEAEVFRHITEWGTSVEELNMELFWPPAYIKCVLLQLQRKKLIRVYSTLIGVDIKQEPC